MFVVPNCLVNYADEPGCIGQAEISALSGKWMNSVRCIADQSET
jgi:hypothetical protein